MKANIINRLGNVRSLHLDGWAFECFAYHSIENFQFTNLEVLSLDIDVCAMNMRELGKMIHQVHGLKTLVISSIVQDIYAGDYAIVSNPDFEKLSAHFLNNENIPRVGLGNKALQNVDIKNFRGSLDEVMLIHSVLRHFPHLRVLNVTPMMKIDEDRLCDFAKLFSRFPRASTNVCMLLGSKEC